jgi:hypothetical protein
MAHLDIVDGLVGGSFLLLTGTEVALDPGSMLEVLSKFGMIGILWFWLKDMRKQIDQQTIKFEERQDKMLKVFEDETKSLKENHEKIVDKINMDHATRVASLETMLREQRAELSRIYESQLTNKD